jgi:hypothetical protein
MTTLSVITLSGFHCFFTSFKLYFKTGHIPGIGKVQHLPLAQEVLFGRVCALGDPGLAGIVIGWGNA